MCDRDALLPIFCRGWPATLQGAGGVQTDIRAALEHFGCRQLDRFREAGLLLWPQREGLPPVYAGWVRWGELSVPARRMAVQFRRAPPSSRAAYIPHVRTVVFRPGENIEYSLTHELAHAWDDLVYETLPAADQRTALDAMPEARRDRTVAALIREYQRRIHMRSTTMRSTRGSPGTLQSMYDDFMAFRRANRGLDPTFGRTGGEETQNVLEFYAEGYAVFHCGPQDNQIRLLDYATRLYDFVESEALQHGLPTPRKDALIRLVQARRRERGG